MNRQLKATLPFVLAIGFFLVGPHAHAQQADGLVPCDAAASGNGTDCTDAVSVTAKIDTLRRIDDSCPPPTRIGEGGDCVLDEDVTLLETLDLTSSTRLNCRGHMLSPTIIGTGITVATYVPSQPEVALLINGGMDVRIQNCRIDDFDFGIVVLNNKVPPGGNPGVLARQRNKIVSNTIRSRVMGALLLAADNNQLSDNFISFSSGAGTGISVVRNCAQNQITNNDISSPGNPLEFARQLPGSSSLASLCSDCGIASFDPPAQVLFNVIVSGELYQFPNSVESRNFDNRFEGNIVTLPGTSTGKSHIGIAAGTRSTRTMILRNVVTSGGIGIAAGGFRSDFSGRSPGRCALDASRYCATNSDCQIPAIDPVSKGACVGVTPQSIDARASDSLIEENNLTGPFSTSAISGGDTLDLTVRGNTIHGTGTETGIRLLSASLETATLTRNVIDRASTALFFDHANGADSRVAPATFFGASVFLNDVTATNSPAIRITNGYSFPSELSVGGQGNYWGHTCAEGGFPAADSPSPLIIDSHPFGTSVASTADSQLPTPCY